MTTQACDVAGCVSRYAERLQTAIGDGHHVASPLGAWLLLALAGPASVGPDQDALTDVLGCDIESAAAAAARLLADPHPLVASAAAVWTKAGAPLSDAFGRWQQGLPPAVTTGALPDQAGLDRWANEHTFGLIDRFPIPLSPAVYLILASALATKVSWQNPFDLAPAAELGPASVWSRQLSQVLRTPGRPRQQGHRQFIAATAEAGDVAVHIASAQHGLQVCSVAADSGIPASAVVRAAHQIGCAHAVGASLQERNLGDLPLGDGPAWQLREEMLAAGADVCTAVLPAWQARSEHDLGTPGLGFDAAKRALAPDDPWQAKQSAVARYSRTGFEAAAITAMWVASSLPAMQRRRVAELRFGHPYAVVAVALARPDQAAGHLSYQSWDGVPVFSAWVAQPEDAADDARTAGDSSARRR